ncbi:hypothetical protein QJ854_gp930 [Moumouvirus goulette]|uniref:Uncharacterized protein n=1 Tax=Moumouvirus goulette TaxID=1247379 RepID=M1PVU9_9VIRU|nr:hypothetical protein QJ854_gp930 [Moumouvirus goulette]AGF84852.1 hypothetical protein glt_00043 [Moumouvirus goulette]
MPTIREQEIYYDHIDSDDNAIYSDEVEDEYYDSDEVEDEFITRTRDVYNGRNKTNPLSKSE